jgi:hypothetical protein
LKTLVATLIGAGLGFYCLSAQANSLGSVDAMPFFAAPYPAYYNYHRPVENPCYQLQRVDTPDGPRLTEVNVCGNPVSAKY